MAIDLRNARARQLTGGGAPTSHGETWIIEDSSGHVYLACHGPTRDDALYQLRAKLRTELRLAEPDVQALLSTIPLP